MINGQRKMDVLVVNLSRQKFKRLSDTLKIFLKKYGHSCFEEKES